MQRIGHGNNVMVVYEGHAEPSLEKRSSHRVWQVYRITQREETAIQELVARVVRGSAASREFLGTISVPIEKVSSRAPTQIASKQYPNLDLLLVRSQDILHQGMEEWVAWHG